MRAQIWTVCLHPSLSRFVSFLLTFIDISGNFFYITERAKREMDGSPIYLVPRASLLGKSWSSFEWTNSANLYNPKFWTLKTCFFMPLCIAFYLKSKHKNTKNQNISGSEWCVYLHSSGHAPNVNMQRT